MFRPRFSIVLLLSSLWAQGTGAAAQSSASAQPPAAAPTPHSLDARALGMAEAMLDYCAKNDPPGAAKVRARLNGLMQGASKEALAEARKSAAYRSAHDSEAAFVSKIDPHNAPRLCSQRAAQRK